MQQPFSVIQYSYNCHKEKEKKKKEEKKASGKLCSFFIIREIKKKK